MAWAPDDQVWYDPRPRAYGDSDPGGGPPFPIPGAGPETPVLRQWYDPEAEEGPGAVSITSILEEWNAVETDMHHFYGVDVDSGILDHRSWRWFYIRLGRLLSEGESMLYRRLMRD